MATKYLDNNGVLYLWGKIKGMFATKSEIPTDNAALTNGAGYQTADNVNAAITAKGYTTLGEVEGKGYITIEDVEEKGYQTSQEVDTAITNKGYTTMTAVEGKGYQTSSEVSAAITAALADVSGVQFSIVDELPETGDAGTIYLVHKSVTAAGNVYAEWIWVNNAWESIGDTTVDLTNYLQKTDIEAITNAEIDTITTTTT